MGITISGLNPGVTAVVIFYLLAGQVVCRLWQRQAQLPYPQRVRWFYRDRLWRILPMYGYVLIVGYTAWLVGADSYFLSSTPGLTDWLNNVLVIPLNYYMFNQSDTFTLLPPAWSLAVELQFYLLVPILLLRSHWLALAWLMSVAVFVAAQSSLLDTDVFGYRLLAGVGFVFICGCWLATSEDRKHAIQHPLALTLLWSGISVYVAILLYYPDLRQPFNLEVALGFAAGLPAVILVSRWKLTGRLHKAQRLAGALSYGVFLAHFPVIWLLELWAPMLSHNVAAVLAGSTLVALIGHLGVERPLWRRHRAFVDPPVTSPGF